MRLFALSTPDLEADKMESVTKELLQMSEKIEAFETKIIAINDPDKADRADELGAW